MHRLLYKSADKRARAAEKDFLSMEGRRQEVFAEFIILANSRYQMRNKYLKQVSLDKVLIELFNYMFS